MPETMPVDQPVRMAALPAEQAAGFRAAARTAVERDPAALAGTGAEVRIAVPAEGQHQAVSVEPGQTVVLEGEAFRSAVYVMQPEGLVVLVEGGTLLLPDVAPTTPIVIDGLQPILAAEMAAAPAVQPEAGQAAAHGGGAGFAAAEAAAMGSGLDAMGPLAATALGHAAAFGEPPAGSARTLRGSLSSDDDGTDGNPGGGSDDDDTDHGGPGDDDNDTDHGGPGGDDGDGDHPGGGDDDDGPGPIANARPLAGDDRVAVGEDHGLTIRAADLLGNDGDADGNPLRITAVDGGRFGEAVLNPDGSITFTPRGDFHGEASFRYTVSDGQGGSDRATVRVEVRPVNDAPVAADDALRTDEDRALRIDAKVLLGNDRDVDGDALRIVGLGDASHGEAVLNPDGSVAFIPDADFHGEASFTYTVGDGQGGFDTAVARIEVAPVNDEPIATDDRLTTAEDTAIRMARGFFTGDDIDVDGDALRIVSVQKAEHGTVELTRNHVVFTPDADFHGEARFTYTISDGHGGLDTATVRIQVNPVNDAPAATCDNVHADEDTPAVFNERRLSSDDLDVDGDRLKVVSVQDARHGTVSLAQDGTITFTPDADFNGEAHFTYTVSDGHGGFDTAGVTVHVAPVNDAPVLGATTLRVGEGMPAGTVVGQLAAVDPDAGGRLYYIVASGNEAGLFTVDPFTGTITTNAPLDHETAALHRLEVMAVDEGGLHDIAPVTIRVRDLDEAPTGITLSDATAPENRAGAVVGRLAVTDPDSGDSFGFTVSDGRFEVDADGRLRLKDGVSLDHEAEPSLTLQVTATDQGGLAVTREFTIEVRDLNEAPVADDATFSLAEGLPAGTPVGQVVATDPDSPAKNIGKLTFAIVGGNEAGLFTIDAATGEIRTAAPLDREAMAEHRLEVVVADRSGNPLSDTASIIVTVGNANEAPTGLALAAAALDENVAGAVVGTLAVEDPDAGDSHVLTVDDGRFEVAGGELRLKDGVSLDHEAEPSVTLHVTATDQGGLGITREFTIEVGDVDEAPAGTADLVLTNRTDGGPVTIAAEALLRNDIDPEGRPLALDGVAGGSEPVSLDANGDAVVDPAGSSFAGTGFAYTASDPAGLATGPVAVTVQAIAGDTLVGGEGDEILIGRNAADTLRGQGGHDWLEGLGGADRLEGGDGDDRLIGGGGDDSLDGGNGRDRLDGGAANDRLSGGNGGDDLFGGAGNDLLQGEQGNDELRGGAGQDLLEGGLGNDILDGGEGDDLLSGGDGVDRFRFSTLGGTDRIGDFQAGPGGDVIDLKSLLSGVGETTGAALQSWLRIEVSGGDSTISIDADGTGNFAAADARITVEGVDLMGGAPDQAAAIDSLVANGNVQAQAA